MILQAELTRLKKNYDWLKKQFGDLLLAEFNLDSLFVTLGSYAGHDDAFLISNGLKPKILDDLIAHLRMVINDFIRIKLMAAKKNISNANILQNYRTYLSKNDILARGVKLVKALNEKNPLSSRAKKYLGFGVAGILLSLILIPAFIFGGFIIGPLTTAFTITYMTGVFVVISHTLAIPVLAVTLGIAGCVSAAGSMAALIKLTRMPTSALSSLASRIIHKNDAWAVGAFVLLTLVGVCILPLVPLIAGCFALKKAYTLSKAPQGLALILANTYPALIEKTHYGDLYETNNAKIKKANQKLAMFRALDKTAADTDKCYIAANIVYYMKRIRYLQAEMKVHSGIAVSETDIYLNDSNLVITKHNIRGFRPNKNNILLESKSLTNKEITQKVKVNFHGNKKRLRLFDAGYNHVKHAQKVEAAVRALPHGADNERNHALR